MANIIEPYINADDIKKATLCSDMEAAIEADRIRNSLIAEKKSFTFETVLSTDRNLKLLQKARDKVILYAAYMSLRLILRLMSTELQYEQPSVVIVCQRIR